MNPFKPDLGIRPSFGSRLSGFRILSHALFASLVAQLPVWGLPPVMSLAPGPIAITSATEASAFNFDPPSARVESASEGAGDAVAALLQTPHVGHPQIEAAIGILQFAATPFVAGYGAIKAGHRKLNTDQLELFERQLAAAMVRAAEQENLRQLVLTDAREITHRQLIDFGGTKAAASSGRLLSGRLETRVLNIELKRLEKSDLNYTLCIAAEARLLSLPASEVLCRQQFNYRSDKAMFIDWARDGGLENVANTGYRLIAHQIAQAFFSPESAEPLVVGAGYSQNGRQRNSSAQRTQSAQVPSPVFRALSSAGETKHFMEASLKPLFVDYRFQATTSFEVLPDTSHPEVFIRGPKTQPSASTETLTETEWALDGLENHRNFVVQAGACIAAIPLGLWEHTIGVLWQQAQEDLQGAQSSLEQITWTQPVQQTLADNIAQTLAAQTSQQVLLRRIPSAGSGETSTTQFFQPASFRRGPQPQGRAPTDADTALQVRVLNIALEGFSRRHSAMHLTLQAEVSLLRTSDGQEWCSFPICYRGTPRKLAHWSANNGTLLKQELEACSIQVANKLVQRLVSESYVIPARTPGTTLAWR